MPEFTAEVSESEHRRLTEFLEAVRTDCAVWISPTSELITEQFESEFRSKLLAHHCFMGSPLFQESFDAAFMSACNTAGFDIAPAPEGQRFWDVRVNGSRISLKSTKAKNLRADFLHISKLTEAAWIQDCRTAKKRQEETQRLFEEYCAEVETIIQLRYFRKKKLYELVEIPVMLFAQIQDVDRALFAADGPTINIPVGKEPPDFTLKLDRSDAKITLASINKFVCNALATWQL